MSENKPYQQLRMVYPEHLMRAPIATSLPTGYYLRTYCPGDEIRFCTVMELAGWQGWNDAKLQPWLPRILRQGWFMVVHQVSNQIVATAMALQDIAEFGSVGGEMGWVASDPAHKGKGLGMVVCSAVTARLIQKRYRHIHLSTEHWRLAAIKTYLKLGYVPFLYAPEMLECWQAICIQLQWRYTPEQWQEPDRRI